MRAELDGMQARADALAQVFGSDEFAERMKRQQATIAAIDSGFLRRELFVARPADEDSASGRVTCASAVETGTKKRARNRPFAKGNN